LPCRYWAYWVNPFAYAFRALAINEFKQQRWAVPLASSSSSSTTTTLGDAVLDMFQVKHEGGWIWNGVGVLLGMSGFCAAVALIAYTFNRLAESPAVQPQQQQQGRKGQRGRKEEEGVVIELPGR
jgi:F0F1-type ATP synthase membrane subunit c/vacuolar-type H+-ATPase subunit K